MVGLRSDLHKKDVSHIQFPDFVLAAKFSRLSEEFLDLRLLDKLLSNDIYCIEEHKRYSKKKTSCL